MVDAPVYRFHWEKSHHLKSESSTDILHLLAQMETFAKRRGGRHYLYAFRETEGSSEALGMWAIVTPSGVTYTDALLKEYRNLPADLHAGVQARILGQLKQRQIKLLSDANLMLTRAVERGSFPDADRLMLEKARLDVVALMQMRVP